MPKKDKPSRSVAENGAPEGAIIVSYSEMDTFRMCPLKHQLAYKERWKKEVKEGSPLARGSLWHKVMEEHYGAIKDAQDWKEHGDGSGATVSKVLELAWKRVRPLLFEDRTGAQSEDQALIQWMYEGYIEQYGIDPDWHIIAIEYGFEINLPDRDGNPSPYWMKGKIDLVIQKISDGSLWIIDHKSGKDLPTQVALEIDDQFGGYTWALTRLGYPVRGSIHNAARTTQNKGDLPGAVLNGSVKKQTLDQRMKRTYMNRTFREAENVALDFWAAAVNAYPESYGYDPLPLYSSPNPKECSWKCDFKESHLIARTGRDIHQVVEEMGFVQDFTRH